MTAFARGAAGYLRRKGIFGQRATARIRDAARTQAEAHLRRYVGEDRARELAAEAAQKFSPKGEKR